MKERPLRKLSRAPDRFTFEPGQKYVLSCRLFLRLLGLLYLFAFISFWVQVEGLIGNRGILPAGPFLDYVWRQIGAVALWRLPTLGWAASEDGALHIFCALGVIAALAALAGVGGKLSFAAAWALYLSLTNVGQIFMGYQWDGLLLEMGLLAIGLAPWRLWGWGKSKTEPSRFVRWLIYWLLFRLLFASGYVKLASGDAVWWDLTALQYHYWTQPLPTPLAWYVHQLPAWAHEISCLIMFFIEMIVPFSIFLSGWPRRITCALLVSLQLMILLTGNYCFFNLLTIIMCLLLLDDQAIGFVFGRPWNWTAARISRLRAKLAEATILILGTFAKSHSGAPETPVRRSLGRLVSYYSYHLRPAVLAWFQPRTKKERKTAPKLIRQASAILGGTAIAAAFLLSASQLAVTIGRSQGWSKPFGEMISWVEGFRSFNRYGLFANMTERRPEIIIEGSNDGRNWQPYGFRWKPGDLARAPRFTLPHQPRLDWQMWFAALDSWESPRTYWLRRFLGRLLAGERVVLALLADNPFPDRPPRFIRAVLYEYEFSQAGAGRAWWTRRLRNWRWRAVNSGSNSRGRAFFVPSPKALT